MSYTHPVVEPLERLTSMPRPVKRFLQQRDGEPALTQPLKKPRIPEEVADRVRVLILDGSFPPGQPLPAERVLAERFGVSRGSIRDALRIFGIIGFFEGLPG